MSGRKLIFYGLALVAVALVALSLLAGVNRVLSYVPFTPQWSERTAQKEAVRSGERARDLEAEGQAENFARADAYQTHVITVQARAAEAAAELRSLPDAETPLDPTRLDKLRAADLGVCRNAASVCPAPDAAPGG